MKIIFLDIDGVLCTTRAHIAQRRAKTEWHMTALDREAVGLLNAIHEHDVDHTRYVLSSTWRKAYDQEYMVNHLRKFGWTGKFHDDWKTPQFAPAGGWMAGGYKRGYEIKDWLDRNKCAGYLILDDSDDMLDDQAIHFVKTDHDYGISLANYYDAMAVLHGMKDNLD